MSQCTITIRIELNDATKPLIPSQVRFDLCSNKDNVLHMLNTSLFYKSMTTCFLAYKTLI